MNSLDKAILDFLNKASKRIKADFLLNLSIVGLKLLLCLSFSLLLISLFITFPYVQEIIVLIIILGLVGINIFGFIKSPKKSKVALIVDSKGLNERLITSLELIGCEDSISIAQKKDTVKVISNFNIKDNFKIVVDKRQILISLGLVIMCILTSFIPSNAKKKAEEIMNFDRLQKEFILKLEEEKQDIQEAVGLTEEEKNDIEKIIDDAIKEINESENKSEINETLERLEKKLDNSKDEIINEKGKSDIEKSKKDIFKEFNKEKQESAKKDLNSISNQLIKSEESESLGEAILSGDKNKISEEIENIQKNLENMSSDQLSRLSEVLNNASKDITSTALSQALSEASSSVLNKEINGENLSDAIEEVLNNKNNGNESSNNSKETSSKGEGNEESQNNGGSSSNGLTGEGNSVNGASGNSGSGWNKGDIEGEKRNEERNSGEEVFIPGINEGNDKNLTGNKNENGETQIIESENGLNEEGSKLDYEKVIGDYTNSALDSINNSNLPENLKDIIKDYFQELN